jgi:hypothetical protein
MKTLLAAAPSYPVPPADLSASQPASIAFLAMCSLVMIAAIVWVVRLALRGETLGMYFLAGGLLMAGLEPYFDYLGLLWFADDNVAIAINLFGRHIPLAVVLGYSFFFGLQSYILYRAILLGKNAKFFLYFYVFAWLFDLFLQAIGRAFGLYQYYGQQPFLIVGVPAWWFSIDAVMPILGAFVLFSLRDRLVGWGKLLVIPILPALYAALNGAAGVPVFTALNSNFDPTLNGNSSTALVWLGGTLTIGLAWFILWLLIGEIGKAQHRAGIDNCGTKISEVLLAKVGIGLQDKPIDDKTLENPLFVAATVS